MKEQSCWVSSLTVGCRSYSIKLWMAPECGGRLQPASKPVSQSPFDVGEGRKEGKGGQSAAVLASLLSQLTWQEPARFSSQQPFAPQPQSSATLANFCNIQRPTCPSACWMNTGVKAKRRLCEVRGHPFKWRSQSAVRYG